MLLLVFPPEMRFEIVGGALEQEEVSWVLLTVLPTLVMRPWANSREKPYFRDKNMSSGVRRTQVQVPRSASFLCLVDLDKPLKSLAPHPHFLTCKLGVVIVLLKAQVFERMIRAWG